MQALLEDAQHHYDAADEGGKGIIQPALDQIKKDLADARSGGEPAAAAAETQPAASRETVEQPAAQTPQARWDAMTPEQRREVLGKTNAKGKTVEREVGLTLRAFARLGYLDSGDGGRTFTTRRVG